MPTNPRELREFLENRRLPSDQPSDLLLDLEVAGELRGPQADALRTKANTDRTLQRRLAARTVQAEEFRRSHDPATTFETQRSSQQASIDIERGWQRRLLWPGLAVGTVVAASVLVLAILPAGQLGTRVKGEPDLRVVVKRADRVFEVETGDHIRPGDQLQITMSSAQDSFVGALSLDPSGKLFAYLPFNGKHTVRVGGGSAVLIPGSVILDETVGVETLVVMVCPQRMSLDFAKQKLEMWFAEHGRVRPPDDLVPSCRFGLKSYEKSAE